MSHHDDNLYTILGRLAALQPKPEIKTSKEAAKKIYESVEARGSILSGVDTVQAKLAKQFAMERDESKLKKGHCSDCDCSPCRCKKCNECGVLESKCRCKPDMTEGAVKDIHMELSRVARDKDYDKLSDLMSDSGTVGRYLQQQIEEITSETGLHPDDDFEEIETQLMAQLMARLKRDFGDDDDMAEGWKQKLRLVDPTIKARIRDLSQDQTNQGLDTIQHLADLDLTSDDMVSRAMKPNTYFKNAARYANLLAKEGVAEGKTIASGLNDWQKKALKHDTYEKYVSHCNRYDYPHMDKRAWQRYKNAFDNMGTQGVAEGHCPQCDCSPCECNSMEEASSDAYHGDSPFSFPRSAADRYRLNRTGRAWRLRDRAKRAHDIDARSGVDPYPDSRHTVPPTAQFRQASRAGREAHLAGEALSTNPYPKGTEDNNTWWTAWTKSSYGNAYGPGQDGVGPIKEGSSGKNQLKQEIRKLEKQARHYSFEPAQTDPETGHGYRPNYIETVEKIKKLQAQLKSLKGVAEVTGDSKFDNMMGDIVKGAVTPGKKVATKDKIGEDIWKMYELFYSYGDSGFDYLDKHTAYWDALFTKHNGDIDALINSESEEKLMIVLKELQDANRKYLDRRDNPLSELASSDNGGGIRIQAKYLGKENFKVVINGESYLAIIENLEGNTLKGKSNTNAYKSGNEHMWDWRIDAINITNNETGDELDDDMTDVVADYIGEHHQADLIKIAIFQSAQTTSWHDQRTRDMGYIVQPTNKFNPDLKKKKPGVAEGETVVKGNVSTHKGTYGNEYQGDPDDDAKAPKVSNSKTGKKGRPTKDEKDTLQAKLPWGGKPPKDTYKPDSKGHEHRMSDEPPKDSPERAAWDEKQARKNNRKPKSIKEEIDSVERRLTEGVNLLELLKEKHQTVDEMLAELSTDIANFKESGHCSELLKDCMDIKGAHKKAQPFTALDIAPAHAITPAATRLPHQFNAPPMEIKMDRELNELARLAGLSEDCGDMPPIGIAMQDMQSEQDNLSISTTYNSRDGKKTISVNADGKQAEDLLQMLRIAGLGSGEKAQELQARPEIEFDNIDGEVSTVPQDDLEELSNEQSPMILGGPGDAEMDEAEFDVPATEPVNGPKPEYQTMKQSTMGPGEGDPGEKAMHPDRATNNNGDNALSTPATPPTRAQKTLIAVSTLESKLAAEYESIKKSK